MKTTPYASFIGTSIVLLLLLGLQATPAGSNNTIEMSRTGQLSSFAPGDDGDLKRGVRWPDPRFTDNNDGTVMDHLTTFVWMKDAGCLGNMNWDDAIDACNNLAEGQCGLTDESALGDWFLPNIRELHSLIDFNAALPAGAPFTNWYRKYFWSSTTVSYNDSGAWNMWSSAGHVNPAEKNTLDKYVLCVREYKQPQPIRRCVQAEDYDEGGQNVSYFDTTPGNGGGRYRNDDVEIWYWYRGGPNHYVACATSEWLEYTVDVPFNGHYRLAILYGTAKNERKIRVEFDGSDKTGPLEVPITGWWTTWQTLNIDVTLAAGQQTMRIVILRGAINMDEICLAYVGK